MGCDVGIFRSFPRNRDSSSCEIFSVGEKGAQESSLEALCTLFMAAPDHAGRLVEDSLPSLRIILREEDVALGVHLRAFRLLLRIVQRSPHSPVIDSGIIAHVVGWLRCVCVFSTFIRRFP